jgi:hypothetical protein
MDIPEIRELPEDPTTADATTVVVSKKGIVGIVDYADNQAGTAGIVSEAYDAELNSAYTGVLGGADLSTGDVFSDEPPTTLLSSLLYNYSEELSNLVCFDVAEEFVPGSVYVAGLGPDGHALILSEATNGIQNIAETVVATPGEVVVIAEEMDEYGMPRAQIKSQAGGRYEDYSINNATTRIYASEVDVRIPGLYRGNGIWAYAAGLNTSLQPVSTAEIEYKRSPHVPYTGDEQNGYDPDDGDGGLKFLLSEYDSTYGTGSVEWIEENEETGTSATLIINDYSAATDLPDCPECPCLEEDGPIPPVPPAPLGVAPIPALEEIDFLQGGCPALMQWLANEVGVQVDVQVFLANAFVSSTDCQPCESAAKLKRAATVLADEDGSYLAAMNQVFNELAPADATFTPEMANSIVTAFAGRVNDGTQYASAIEYIDAFVQYIAVLNTEMGSPVEDSVAYVMDKYGAGVSGSDNPNMGAFLATRMESGESFTQ